MDLLKSDYFTLVDLFLKAKKQVILCLPNINIETANALLNVYKEGININLFIEFDECIYRNGFGDIEAVSLLRENNITIINKQGLNLYFIVIDSWGYFFFPKGPFIEKPGDAYDLFPMEEIQVKKIKFLYGLLDDNDSQFDDIIEEVGIEKLKDISKGLKPILQEQAEQLEEKLKNDPVLKPNFGRTLEVYKAKFQIVELKFQKANLHVKKIKLPKDALPFKDDNLKRAIEANLRLFTDIPEKEFFKPFFKLKTDLDVIRHKYLHYIKSRNKCIIKREEKGPFEDEVKRFQKECIKLKDDLLIKLQEEIGKTRKIVSQDLLDFLKINVPDEFSGLHGTVLEDELKNFTINIIGKIRFPSAKYLLTDMGLEYNYYDITWADLNNPQVIKEMETLKLLNKQEKAYFDEFALSAKKVN